MALIEKRAATRTDLKWFGLVTATCFALLGTVAWLRDHHGAAATFWGVGGVIAVLYYSVQQLQRVMFDLWMAITFPIGWFVSHLTLTLMFCLVLTPLGLLMRMLGRDPMHRVFDRAAASYWEPHDPGSEPNRYFHQL
jgi:hypothetical protein